MTISQCYSSNGPNLQIGNYDIYIFKEIVTILISNMFFSRINQKSGCHGGGPILDVDAGRQENNVRNLQYNYKPSAQQ